MYKFMNTLYIKDKGLNQDRTAHHLLSQKDDPFSYCHLVVTYLNFNDKNEIHSEAPFSPWKKLKIAMSEMNKKARVLI